VHTDERATVIDDRLVLSDSVESGDRNELWNLRLLFEWVERAREDGNERLGWIGNEVVEALKAGIEARTREVERDALGIGAWA
jgi:anaphase-promoting complex subunit 1